MPKALTVQDLAHRVKTLEAENLELRKALRRLQVDAERFREFTEFLPDIVFEMDEQGTLTFVNRKAYEITGYSREDFEKGFEAADLLVPEDRERARENLARRFRGEEVGMTAYTARRKDGSTFPVLGRATPILRKGKAVGLRGFLVDTTELRKAEEALRDSEEKYRQLFLTESDALVLLYTDTGELIDVNDTALEMYGFTKEELLQLKITDISAEPEATWRGIQEHAPDGRSRVPLRYHRKKDGTVFPIEASTSTFSLQGRQVLCGAVRDISERIRIERELGKYRERLERLVGERTAELERTNRELIEEIAAREQIEEALRESEERFRTVFDGSLDAIVLLDPDTGEVLDVNPTAYEAVSMPYDEMIGLHYQDFVPPESQAYVAEIFGRVVRDDLSEQPSEIPVRRGHGRSILFEVLGQLIQIDGRPVVLATLRDVTERNRVEQALRESEARYRDLFDESPLALWEVDASCLKSRVDRLHEEGIRDLRKHFEDHPEEAMECFLKVRVNDTNKANLALFEAGSKEAFRKNVRSILLEHEDVFRTCASQLATVAEGKRASEVEDVTVLTLQGRKRRVFYRWTVAPGHERSFRKVLVSVFDITEHKQMEQELQKIQKLESLGILAGGIAHDFNNILTAISTNLSMARLYGDLGPDLSQMLADAEKASMRAQGLTQQLLAFAKGGRPVKTTVSVAALIRETAEFALSGSKTRCELSLPGDLWLVEADPAQIGQVLQNLIINADQAMPRGGTVRIKAENVLLGEKHSLPLAQGMYLKLCVTDEGVGISAKDLPSIFDPFFTTKQRGSGLGLTTAFAIVSHHGGHIEVQSEVAEGTTFSVYLPALGRAFGEQEKGERGRIRGEGRVLLVDDEKMIRRATGQAATRLGYEVQFAEDGTQAIRRYEEAMRTRRPFQAVIMDLTIPGGMGGQEAAAAILRIDPGAKIIVSSGYANDPVMSQYRQYGFSAVITKPYRIEELEDVLKRFTRGSDS